MKHEAWELKQMQSLPLEAKIRMTQNRIRQWYEYFNGEVYVSFSGGKDSTVLLHLVRSLYPDVEAVFVDTGLEYPEIRDFVKTFENVTWIRPKLNFKQVISKYGYPVGTKAIAQKIKYARLGSGWAKKYVDGTAVDKEGRPSLYRVSERWKCLLDAPFTVASDCCNVMKKEPIKRFEKETSKVPFIGTLACESQMRERTWAKHGCNAFDSKKPSSQPLSFWTENDVLAYLKEYGIPYCSLYGDIVDNQGKLKTTKANRTGCMFCMFGCHLEKEPNRFQRMKETHPKQYEFCMKSVEEGGLGLGTVLDYINVKHD